MMTSNWTDDELLAYILIYCSLADLSISEPEKEYLTSRFSKNIYDKMYEIIVNDSEIERRRKIKDAYDDHIYNNDETDVIYEEIHNIFTVDGEFDQLEKNLWTQLDDILSGSDPKSTAGVFDLKEEEITNEVLDHRFNGNK